MRVEVLSPGSRIGTCGSDLWGSAPPAAARAAAAAMPRGLGGQRPARGDPRGGVGEVAEALLAGLPGVDVRGVTVAGQKVAGLEEGLGDVSVEVHRGTDDGVGPDGGADRGDQVALGV